jgi:hypothetical protein
LPLRSTYRQLERLSVTHKEIPGDRGRIPKTAHTKVSVPDAVAASLSKTKEDHKT